VVYGFTVHGLRLSEHKMLSRRVVSEYVIYYLVAHTQKLENNVSLFDDASLLIQDQQLSKEEESETTDNEVTKEDQDKINEFSKLHNRSKIIEDELETKKVSDMRYSVPTISC